MVIGKLKVYSTFELCDAQFWNQPLTYVFNLFEMKIMFFNLGSKYYHFAKPIE